MSINFLETKNANRKDGINRRNSSLISEREGPYLSIEIYIVKNPYSIIQHKSVIS
jgi:hypothetical protein